MTELEKAARQALEALEEIALAGMSGSGQETPDGITAWHARQAWKFISIAARQLEPLRQALANEALDRMVENARELGLDYEPAGGTQVSKVWWDGEKLMAKPIPLSEVYKEPEQQLAEEPVAWVNSSDVISSKVNRERGGHGDTHTWSETKNDYHKTPLYTRPQPADEHKQALREATQIATWLWKNFYKDTAPQWEVLPDICGVLSQIDNMVAGLKYSDCKPVAWMFEFPDKRVAPKFDSAPHGGNWTPLYTRPQPAAQWVGLTDADIKALWAFSWTDGKDAFARAIEAKLREKNGGKA